MPSIFGSLYQGPQYRVMTGDDLWRSAIDQPLASAKFLGINLAALGAGIQQGVNETTYGTVLRAGSLPSLASDRAGDDRLTREVYEASPDLYRAAIPWEAGLTRTRAAAKARAYDETQVRLYWMGKSPVEGFIGSIIGQATDPVNYLPVAGPLLRAANILRVGRIATGIAGRVGGSIGLGALDAVANTAIFRGVTYGERRNLGDHVSAQSFMLDLAMAGVIGGAFGALRGVWNARHPDVVRATTTLDTIRNLGPASRALNEQVHALAGTGEVAASRHTAGVVDAVFTQVEDLLALPPPRMALAGVTADDLRAALARAGDAGATDRVSLGRADGTTLELSWTHGVDGAGAPLRLGADDLAALPRLVGDSAPAEVSPNGLNRSWQVQHNGRLLRIDEQRGGAGDTVRLSVVGEAAPAPAAARLAAEAGIRRMTARLGTGGRPEVIELSPVAASTVDVTRPMGIDLSGYRHAVDSDRVRHVLNEHSDPLIEKNRGQLVVTDADFADLPAMLDAPTHIVTDLRNGKAKAVAYVLRDEDKAILYLAQAQTGKHRLSLVSLRKFAPNATVGRMIRTLRQDGHRGQLEFVARPLRADQAEVRVRPAEFRGGGSGEDVLGPFLPPPRPFADRPTPFETERQFAGRRELAELAARGDIKAIEAHPALRAAQEQLESRPPTASRNDLNDDTFLGRRTYTIDRERVTGADSIVARLVDWQRGGPARRLGIPAYPVARQRRAVIVIGPPGAGKSSISDLLAARLRAGVVDADEIKTIVPGYDEGLGAGAVHAESVALSLEARRGMISAGDNLVLTRVIRKLKDLDGMRTELEGHGYKVSLALVDVPSGEAFRRMVARFGETSWLVDLNFFAKAARDGQGRFVDVSTEVYKQAVQKGNFAEYVELGSPPGRLPVVRASTLDEIPEGVLTIEGQAP